VIGYLLALFAVVAGMLPFPFSSVLTGLFYTLIGSFFVVAIAVISMTYLFITIAVSRALMGLGRRLLFGANQNPQSPRISKPSLSQKDLESQGNNTELWDRWIDGVR